MPVTCDDYHLHSHYCDGQGELTEWIEVALARRLSGIGFSSHAPVAFPTDWTMPLRRLPRYVAEVRELQAHYRRRLEVCLGLELDFVPGLASFQQQHILGQPLDYVIGAVHFVGGEGSAVPWSVDGPAQLFDRGLREEYGGDILALVGEYYRRVRAMLHTGHASVVGHLDRILRNNVGERYFGQSAAWYRREVEDTLQVVAARQTILGFNTAGWYTPVGLPNPSPWVLPCCRELGIRVTLGSDAHRPEHLGRGLLRAMQLLRQVGYKEVWRFRSGVWEPSRLADAD